MGLFAESTMVDHHRLKELIKESALQYSENGFKLSSGSKSDHFIDMSKVTHHAEGLDIISWEIARRLSYTIDAVGGPLTGAAPIVSGVILSHRRLYFDMAKSLRGFLVRKEPKNDNYIEGFLKLNDQVLIVEDVVTTGNQVLHAVRQTEKFGAKVAGIIAVVDRLEGASELLANYNFISLLTMKDLLS